MICSVDMPNLTVRKVVPKKGKRRETTICLVVNTPSPSKQRSMKGQDQAREKGWMYYSADISSGKHEAKGMAVTLWGREIL